MIKVCEKESEKVFTQKEINDIVQKAKLRRSKSLDIENKEPKDLGSEKCGRSHRVGI